jgi:hypothetical protein
VQLNGSDVTSLANVPDSFTYEMKDMVGAALSPAVSGSMTHSTTTDATWEAVPTAPTLAGTYHLHGVVVKGTDVGFFHDTVVISSRH